MRQPKDIKIGEFTLAEILERHKHWWFEDCDGWKDMRANLTGANLYGAALTRADLTGADLTGAYLSRADLTRADLYGADLTGAENVPFIPYACPDFGIFIGFKKANGLINGEIKNVLVTLEIPEEAKRLSSTGRKCRCDKAKVLRITDLKEMVELETAYSQHDNSFIYEVGKVVTVDDFDENRWNECSTGIHFFINKQEAINYCL